MLDEKIKTLQKVSLKLKYSFNVNSTLGISAKYMLSKFCLLIINYNQLS